jgi:hypothetical protein
VPKIVYRDRFVEFCRTSANANTIWIYMVSSLFLSTFLITGGVSLANDTVDWLAAISLPEISEQFANLPAHWRVAEGINRNNRMPGLIDYIRQQHY